MLRGATHGITRIQGVEIMKSQQTTHRMSMRVPISLPVTIEFPSGTERNTLQAVTSDLSFDGAFILHRAPAPKEGTIARLILKNAPDSPLVIDALVLRSTTHGTGFMFAHYNDELFDGLAALIGPALDRYVAPNIARTRYQSPTAAAEEAQWRDAPPSAAWR